jgi:hypothetical protein
MKITILRYLYPHEWSSPGYLQSIWQQFPPADDIRLMWSPDQSLITVELYYSCTSYDDSTTIGEILERFNVYTD